jgi:hypothetical protein
MSKKLPYSGNAAKKGREFYSSGINRLMNRIDKLEHQVFCCSDDTDEVIDVTSSTYTAAANKDGAFYTLNLAGGITFNLPEATAANVGWNCTLAVETTFTGTMTVACGSTSDLFVGGVTLQADDGQDESFLAVPDVSNDDQLVADADTKGRLIGGTLRIKIIDVNRVWIEGTLHGAGATLATPFA